ncbi:MAG: hypothetical protein ACFFC7_04605 [Candidatus Hermodarchaeota archaeon]
MEDLVIPPEFLIILYNVGFLVLFFIWLKKRDIKLLKFFQELDIRILWAFCLLLFLIISFISFNLPTDVDDAVVGGAKAFLNGHNPYMENVVPHTLPNNTDIKSVYHYFPPDLLTYAFFVFIFGFISSPILTPTIIMLLANLIILLPTYIFFDKILREKLSPKRSFPLFLVLSSPFIVNNSILMLAFFVIGYFFWNTRQTCYISKQENKILGMIFYVLSASVKYMTGILILVHFFDDLKVLFQQSTPFRGRFLFLLPYFLASLVLASFCLPFGLFEVFKAVFLYQGDPSYRGGVAAMTGPFLIEFLVFIDASSLYIPVAAIIFVLAFSYSFYNKSFSLVDKQVFLCFLAMFILPFYATELFVIPLFLWFLTMLKNTSHSGSTVALSEKTVSEI